MRTGDSPLNLIFKEQKVDKEVNLNTSSSSSCQGKEEILAMGGEEEVFFWGGVM